MIVSVDKQNEKEWAELCVKLWPDGSQLEWYIENRGRKYFKYEFLYLINGQAAAFISLNLRYEYVEGCNSEGKPVGYVEGIYVEPDYRKQGIAKKLVEFAKQWAIENGCEEFASDCYLSNKDSRNFHKAVGFEEAAEIIHFKMKLK